MSNKICTIVGVGEGVSFSVAKKFGAEGFKIVLISRSNESVEKAKTELDSLDMDSVAYKADASDKLSLLNAFSKITNEVGHTSVLVYNVAVLKEGLPSSYDYDLLVNDFKSNVGGALVSTQAVVENMKFNKQGTILLTGGGLALEPYPAYASLAVGKSGLRSLTFSLAGELAIKGIHVATVTICGYVKKDSKFDPDIIAEEYWRLHCQPVGKWDREFIFK